MARWVEGRPWVSRERTLHLLHVRSGPAEIDLIQVLEDQGFVPSMNADGSIDCRKPLSSAEPCPPAPPPPKFKSQCAQATSPLREQQRLVQEVGEAVARQCQRPIRWTFTLIEAPEPNAWTPGEGQVFVSTGLLGLKLSRDELAGVLGHEVAHGARHHLEFKNQQAQRTNQAQAKMEEAYQEYLRARCAGDPSQALYRMKVQAQVYSTQNSYYDHEQTFNHANELEADALGLDYCIAAGFRADGMLTALQKMQASKNQRGSHTHPDLGRRIQRIQELLRRRGY